MKQPEWVSQAALKQRCRWLRIRIAGLRLCLLLLLLLLLINVAVTIAIVIVVINIANICKHNYTCGGYILLASLARVVVCCWLQLEHRGTCSNIMRFRLRSRLRALWRRCWFALASAAAPQYLLQHHEV